MTMTTANGELRVRPRKPTLEEFWARVRFSRTVLLGSGVLWGISHVLDLSLCSLPWLKLPVIAMRWHLWLLLGTAALILVVGSAEFGYLRRLYGQMTLDDTSDYLDYRPAWTRSLLVLEAGFVLLICS